MDTESGRLYDLSDKEVAKLPNKENLVPFGIGETVEIEKNGKKCYFIIRDIRTDKNRISLRAIPSKEGIENMFKQMIPVKTKPEEINYNNQSVKSE